MEGEAGELLRLEPLPEEEREWLLDGLATLIRRRGFETFVTSRILLPNSADFPDDVPEGAAGARVLILRLMWHAGMEQHRARIKVYEERTFGELDQRGLGHAGPGTAAWFAGIENDVCEFGVNAGELRDREELIGTLGHEVAHAFRHHHGLRVRDQAVEERLTDLTSVYLGFGAFLLNSSASFKTGGMSASGDRLLYEKRERGYLAPRQIALLLAAQVVTRGVAEKQQRAIAAELSPNHRKLFNDACELLAPSERLRQRLGVPERQAWPAHPARTPIANALPLDDDDDELEDEDAEADADWRDEAASAAPQVHRVESNLSGVFGFAGALLPLAGGALSLLEGWPLLGAAGAGGALGFLAGSCVKLASCSQCRASLPRAASRCDRCGGDVRAAADRSLDDELGEDEDAPEREDDTLA